MKRIGTMSIRDILRHRHGFGLTRAEVASAVGVSTGTVSHILERASLAGLSWPLPEDVDDEELRARLYPPASREGVRVQPDWDAVLAALQGPRERRRARLTRRQLWVEYRDEARAQGEVAYGYSQFCALLKERLGSRGPEAQMRFAYEPGLYGLSDFSGKTLALRTGRGERDVEIFVAVLAHSGLTWAEAVPGPEGPSLDDGASPGAGVLRRRAAALDRGQPQGGRGQAKPRGAAAEPELPRVRPALRPRGAARPARPPDGQGHGGGGRGRGAVAHPAGVAPRDLLLAGDDERRDPPRARPAQRRSDGERGEPPRPLRGVRARRAGPTAPAALGVGRVGRPQGRAELPREDRAQPLLRARPPYRVAPSKPGSASVWSNCSSTAAANASPSIAA